MTHPSIPAQWPHLAGRVQGREHVLPVRVYYEDTDAGGVVYHASYLRFCERARSDWLRLMGIHHGELTDDAGRRLYFVVRRMACEFNRPARLDDVLQVRTRLLRASRVRLELAQDICVLQGAQEPSPQTGPIFSARVTVAVIDDSGRPARLPAADFARLRNLLHETTGE